MSEGLLEEIGQLLYHRRASSVIITHSCRIIADLCSSYMGQQVDHGCTSCVPVPAACARFVCAWCLKYINRPDKVMLNLIIVT